LKTIAFVALLSTTACSSVLGLNTSDYQSTANAYCTAYHTFCSGQDFGFGTTEGACETMLEDAFNSVDPSLVQTCLANAVEAGAGPNQCVALLTCGPLNDKLTNTCVSSGCISGGVGCCTSSCTVPDGGVPGATAGKCQ
jgi:hypothetical protein